MKAGTSKVAVSLPTELLEEVERARAERGESRSQFVRRALVRQLGERQQREDVERYVDSYRDQPESEVDVWAVGASAASLAEEPWE